MELREWLIILGLILMAIIVIDGVRRLQRQRQSSHLDTGRDARHEKSDDDIARETSWELPNGGARRVVGGATVQPPVRQTSAFERRGLKTRVPDAEHTLASERSMAAAAAGGVAMLAVAPEASGSKASKEEKQKKAENTEWHNTTETQAHHTPTTEPSTDVEEICSAREEVPHADVADMDTEYRRHEVSSHDTADVDSATTNERESNVDSEKKNLASRYVNEDDEALTPDPFEAPDDEEIDDPRYEGLSEILWRRPMDGFAHFKEVMAERRERKEKAREEARIRRHKARARRAEAKEKRRIEREERLAQAREDALALQARQQQEETRAPHPASRHHRDPLASLDEEDPLFSTSRRERYDDEPGSDETFFDEHTAYDEQNHGHDRRYAQEEPIFEDRGLARHPDIERARRHLVNGTQARETLASATEVIAIAVMARDGSTFDGMVLLKLMLACGLRYCPTTRVFHRFESDNDHSPLQFSVIDTLKPGEFPLEEMDEFSTKGVWLLMPVPGADELSMAFEAMYETARAIARYLDGELRDENQSVITAQTVEFSRQRVQEFERRAKLYQASH